MKNKLNDKAIVILEKIYDQLGGPWDCVVIDEKLYKEIQELVIKSK